MIAKKTVIIGGTGMLAQASRTIAQKSGKTILISRSPETLAMEIGAGFFAMDWGNKSSISKVLDALQKENPIDCLVSWIHDKGLSCLSDFENLLDKNARSIRIHGSAAGDPRNGIAGDPDAPRNIVRQNVVLGWMGNGANKRWLTDQEISGGVTAAFENPARSDSIVGNIN